MKRLVNQLDPTIARLLELRDQNIHLPTAFNASKHIIDRVMGLIGKANGEEGSKQPVINVGIAIGGMPEQHVSVSVPELPAAGETVDADYMTESDD